MKDSTTRKNLICDWLKNPAYVPMNEKELALFMQVGPDSRDEFRRLLMELLQENRILVTKKGKFIISNQIVYTGTFVSNQRGFGFVEVEGMDEDLFVPEKSTGQAFHGDIVEARLLPGRTGKRQEAEIIRIVERGITQVVGTYEKCKGYGFVIPDDTKISEDIFVPVERSKGAVDGHKVVVELTYYGDKALRKKPEGKVVEILGHINDPGVDILGIVRGFGIPDEFPEKVLNQAERVSQPVSEADRNGRNDYRDIMMVTIDGEDAKDLDDAVSLSIENGLYKLGVHIADVTNYVQENSALDHEAKKRGTSVYLADRVIPMLPHALSNGICSLNAGEDRLALSCMMWINERGELVDHEISESVIHVDRRMSYTIVNDLLTNEESEYVEEYAELVPMFQEMASLSMILRNKRRKRGAVDFDFPETRIKLNEDGIPIGVESRYRNVATDLIEDFMLMANETVAEHFYWLESPFVYRSHETPDIDKMKQLAAFVKNMGFSMKVSREEIHPKEIQKLLHQIEGSEREAMISRLALRSMKQAKYTTECSGHFGLACEYYCHFTSPIRRYPDLQIHRIIKEHLRGRMNQNRLSHYQEILPLVASASSRTERRAEEAEREVDKLKKAQYMEQFIGDSFEGIISGVTSWGVYVELPNTIEGMIHVATLTGDFYEYDEKNYELVGKDSGKIYRLGQTIKIKVSDVDRHLRIVRFVEDDEA